MKEPSLELHELGSQFNSRERFQLYSGETNFSRKFRRLWFSARTPLQTIITQATFIIDDPETLLTIGRNFIVEHSGKELRYIHDDALVHKIIPVAIAHTRNTRRFYLANLEGERICKRKSPHFVVLFDLLEKETRRAQEIVDDIRNWRDNPEAAEPWQVALSKDANHSLTAIKCQLEDSVRHKENCAEPIVERIEKGVYRLMPEKRERVEKLLCCLDVYLDWSYCCEITGVKLPRVGYRFFKSHHLKAGTRDYVRSPDDMEYERLLTVAPYNTDAFYRSHPVYKQGSFDEFSPDHIAVGSYEFFHGAASRHRIAKEPKARRSVGRLHSHPAVGDQPFPANW